MSSRARAKPVLNNIPSNRISIETSKQLVTVRMRGGLGNRFFQTMVGLGYAERTGREFVFYEDNMKHNAHTDYVKTTEILLAFFPKVKVYRGQMRWTNYSDIAGGVYTYTEIPDLSGSVCLSGYYQRFEYFPREARANFVIPKPSSTSFDTAPIDFNHTYFIHFRRGDYVNSNYDLGFTEYYTAAIKKIRDADPAAFFLVFSDQTKKVNLSPYALGGLHSVVPERIKAWETLWLMSRCRGAVCANSTFSWFGAFAIRGPGPIHMPAHWIKDVAGNPNPPWVLE